MNGRIANGRENDKFYEFQKIQSRQKKIVIFADHCKKKYFSISSIKTASISNPFWKCSCISSRHEYRIELNCLF